MCARGVLPALALVFACGAPPVANERPPPGTVQLEFEAAIDPASRGMTIDRTFARNASALVPATVVQDGVVGSGPFESVELVTSNAATDALGTGPCAPHPSSFCADVAIRSFYHYDALRSVFVELVKITPAAGHLALNSDPAEQGLSNFLGLWSYGDLEPFESSTRRWIFGDDGLPYRVRGRVMAELPPPDPAVTLPVSVTSSGELGDGFEPSISADGRFVAFRSSDRRLLPGPDANTLYDADIFVRDMTSDAITLVSVNGAGEQGNYNSRAPAISADGRVVAFQSGATNLAPDTAGLEDVFARDLVAETTVLVSGGLGGAAPNGSSDSATLSADGRWVAFVSRASNLIANDTNGTQDVFVRDLATNTTVRASLAADGSQIFGPSGQPFISAGGRYVAFSSSSADVTAEAAPGLFVRDLVAGTTTFVAGDPAERPSISGDGLRIAFQSAAANLVPDDTNGLRDIFVRDFGAGTITRVSVDSHGFESDGDSLLPEISSAGAHVTFSSRGENLGWGDANQHYDVFVRDLFRGKTVRVSITTALEQIADGALDSAISADGRFIAFQSLGGVHRRGPLF